MFEIEIYIQRYFYGYPLCRIFGIFGIKLIDYRTLLNFSGNRIFRMYNDKTVQIYVGMDFRQSCLSVKNFKQKYRIPFMLLYLPVVVATYPADFISYITAAAGLCCPGGYSASLSRTGRQHLQSAVQLLPEIPVPKPVTGRTNPVYPGNPAFSVSRYHT